MTAQFSPEVVERQIASYIKTLADAAANSGSDFNQGVVRGLEIAAAQFEHGHARQHVPALAALEASGHAELVEALRHSVELLNSGHEDGAPDYMNALLAKHGGQQ